MLKRTLLASIAISTLIFSGCNKDESPTSSNPASIPSVPTANETNGTLSSHDSLPNAEVTTNELDSLASALMTAVSNAFGGSSSDYDEGSSTMTRMVRAVYSESVVDSIMGLHSGKLILSGTVQVPEDESWATAQVVETAHDFSDDGKLFLGGEIGLAMLMVGENMDIAVKGTLGFAGVFQGKIVYDCTIGMNIMNQDATPAINGSIKIVSGANEFDLLSEEFAEYMM